MSLPPDPLGRSTFLHRTERSTYLEIAPGQEVCDFCLDPDPTWEYPCGVVVIDGHPRIECSDDSWLACERCHELLEAWHLQAMAREMVAGQRSRKLVPGYVSPPRAQQIATMIRNLRRFAAARTGPPRPFHR